MIKLTLKKQIQFNIKQIFRNFPLAPLQNQKNTVYLHPLSQKVP